MSEKKERTYVIVIVLLLIIIVAFGIYILFMNEKTKTSNKNKESEEQEVTKTDDDAKDNTVKSQDNNENSIDNQDEIKELNLNNCLNGKTGVVYKNPTDVSVNLGLSMAINNDKKSITLNINWNEFGKYSGESTWSPETKSYQITGFTKEVSSVFIGGMGQDAKSTTLFYIMSDKTVEYTPVFFRQENDYAINYTLEYSEDGSVTGEHFETKGQLAGVANVVKLYNIDAHQEYSSGWRTTIAATKDGSFYDLGNIIIK